MMPTIMATVLVVGVLLILALWLLLLLLFALRFVFHIYDNAKREGEKMTNTPCTVRTVFVIRPCMF